MWSTQLKTLAVWVKTNSEKFFKRWEYQTALPDFWEIWMQVKEQKLELDIEHQTGSKLRKKYVKVVYCHLAYLCAEYITWNAGLDKAQAGIKIAEININNLRYADDTTLMAESIKELKSILMKVKKESEKAGLKLNIQKTKIRASGPINSWQIDKWQPIFLGSKITADGGCSHEIKRCLLLGRKAMANLDNVLKSRDITFPTKLYLVKAMVFPVVMCGCESWTIKKAEHWRINPFELWCWKRLLTVPWTARWSNQTILKEISVEYSLEGLMLKLKLQYSVHLMCRSDSLGKTWCWKRLKAGGIGDDRGWDG